MKLFKKQISKKNLFAAVILFLSFTVIFSSCDQKEDFKPESINLMCAF